MQPSPQTRLAIHHCLMAGLQEWVCVCVCVYSTVRYDDLQQKHLDLPCGGGKKALC